MHEMGKPLSTPTEILRKNIELRLSGFFVVGFECSIRKYRESIHIYTK